MLNGCSLITDNSKCACSKSSEEIKSKTLLYIALTSLCNCVFKLQYNSIKLLPLMKRSKTPKAWAIPKRFFTSPYSPEIFLNTTLFLKVEK